MQLVNIGLLIDGTGGPPARNQAIIVVGSHITWIGPQERLPQPATDIVETILDVQGCTVLPGLIESHVHLQSPSAGSDPPPTVDILFARKYFDPVGITVLRIARNAQLALAAGITTVRDCGSREGLARQVRDAVNLGIIVGPRIVAAGRVITTTAGHGYLMGYEADNADEIRRGIRTEVKAGSDFIKLMATGGFGTPGTNVFEPQYTAAELRAGVDDAHRLGRKVAAHVYGRAAIGNCVQAGVDSLEHCSWLKPGDTVYGTDFDAEIASQMAEKGLYLATALGVGERVKRLRAQTRGPQAYEAYLREREVHCGNIRRMVESGVRMCTSTDAGSGLGFRVDKLALNAEDFVDMVGLTPMQALLAVTANPAQMMGIADRVGTLEVGKQADLVIVKGDPLREPQALQHIHTVVRAGQIVARDGALSDVSSPSGHD